MTFDTRALNHILTHTPIYQRGERERKNLIRILGRGLLSIEGMLSYKRIAPRPCLWS